ncbi:MAG: hypothetical protein V4489_02605 [Chlamydiota bacterium]
MIEQNVARLKQYDLKELMSHSTIDEVNGEIVCYVNLLVDKRSGEILNLSSEILWAENTISTPIAIKTKDLSNIATTSRLELVSEEGDLSNSLRTTIEKSLTAFNMILLARKPEV